MRSGGEECKATSANASNRTPLLAMVAARHTGTTTNLHVRPVPSASPTAPNQAMRYARWGIDGGRRVQYRKRYRV